MLALAAALVAVNPPVAPAKDNAPLKVLVLDVDSADLKDSEKATLTNLEAAHLGEDARLEVLSGADLRQLVKLQGQAQEIGVDVAKCTDSCMAELAGALGAGVVIATQAGKLGETFVVTLAVFDAAKAKSVSRKSIEAASIGELPAKLGPALDALVQPLVAGRAPAVDASAQAPLAPGRMADLYAAEALQVCTDARDATQWWFCDKKAALTENAFVSRYQQVVGAHDLDRAQADRSGHALVPVGLFALTGVGVVLFAGTMTCALSDVCGTDAKDALNSNGGGLGAGIALIGAFGAIAATVGGVLTIPSQEEIDGTPAMHTLSEGEGRGAVARYNEALKAKLAHDLGP